MNGHGCLLSSMKPIGGVPVSTGNKRLPSRVPDSIRQLENNTQLPTITW